MRLNNRTETTESKYLSAAISIKVLTTIEDVEQFSEEWLQFWQNNVHATPFNSPQWLLPWLKYFGESNPYLITVKYQNNLIACIPLYIFTSPYGERQLKLIGTGNSDYLDILVDEAFAVDIIKALLNFIRNYKEKFDICEFYGQRDHSFLIKNMNRFSGIIVRDDVSPVADLNEDFDKYIKRLSAQFRKNTYRAVKQLTSKGFNILKADQFNYDGFMQKLLELHKSEWNARKQQGVLQDPKVQEFLNDSISEYLKTGHVRLYALKSGDDYAAIDIIFNVRDTAYFYIGGYNIEFDKFSPGSVLLWEIIEDCIENGIKRFDFLKGSEPYKYRWGAADVQISKIVLYPDSQTDSDP